MPCHNLEIITSQSAPDGSPVNAGAKKNQVQSFVSNRQEVLPEQRGEFGAGQIDTTDLGGGPGDGSDSGGSEFYHATWRFDFAEDRADLRDTMLQFLSNNFEWAIARYHECDHTDEDRGGCSWDNEWHIPDTASIPEDVLGTFGTGAGPDGGV